MKTERVGTESNGLEPEKEDPQRHTPRSKAAVFVLVGALVIAGVVFQD